MSKRNLNEVLGFISRWGQSEFSLRLLDEALSSGALASVANAASLNKKDREDSLRKLMSDPATDPLKKMKADDLLKKLKSSATYDPNLKGQKKDPVTGDITVGGKKPTLTEPGFLGVLHPSEAGKPGSLKQLGREALSGVGKALKLTGGTAEKIIGGAHRGALAFSAFGSMLAGNNQPVAASLGTLAAVISRNNRLRFLGRNRGGIGGGLRHRLGSLHHRHNRP